jgi:hypothetical protein
LKPRGNYDMPGSLNLGFTKSRVDFRAGQSGKVMRSSQEFGNVSPAGEALGKTAFGAREKLPGTEDTLERGYQMNFSESCICLEVVAV